MASDSISRNIRPPFGADAPLARSSNRRITRADLNNARRIRADSNGVVIRDQQVGPTDRNDLFRFKLTNPSFLVASIRRNNLNINTTLLDRRGRTIAGVNFTSGRVDDLLTFSVQPGIYYIRVYSRRGITNYRLSLRATLDAIGGNIGDDGGVGGGGATPTQTTRLFRDINPGSNNADPSDLTVVGNSLYFAADNGLNGRELFRVTNVNGNPQPIIVNPAPNQGSDPRDFVNLNNTLFFSATDGVNGRQIFRIGNNDSQPTRVSSINPGAVGSNPLGLTVFNNILYFAADGVGGRELYRSDGTPNGTFRVADINPGVDGSNPTDFAVVGNLLYFAANNGLNGRELYSTDGTAIGTRLVADLNIGGGIGANANSSIPTDLVNLNNVLFFAATGDDTLVGRQLWRYDPAVGLNSLRQPVSNILNGTSGSNPGTDLSLLFTDGVTSVTPDALNTFLEARPNRSAIVPIANQVYFAATSSVFNRQLYRSNGTTAGTTIAAQLSTDGNSLNPTSLANINNILYFAGTSSLFGTEFYRFNPAAPAANNQPTRISDINPGSASSDPADFVLFENNIIFVATTPEFGRELRIYTPPA